MRARRDRAASGRARRDADRCRGATSARAAAARSARDCSPLDSSTCTKRCSSPPSIAGSKTTSTVKRGKPGQRIGVDDEPVVGAVELHRRSRVGLDDARRADDGHGMAANPLQVVDAATRPAPRPAAACATRLPAPAAHRDGKTIAHDDHGCADGSRQTRRWQRVGVMLTQRHGSQRDGSARSCCGCTPRSKCPSAVGSGYGDVSVSSPTCVREKSPGATVVEPSPL